MRTADGLGMTVAACEALALDEQLRLGSDGLARRFAGGLGRVGSGRGVHHPGFQWR